MFKWHGVVIVVLVMAGLVALASGCDSASESESCTPGVTRYCTCDEGLPGTQVCLYDGSGYSRCVCGIIDGDTDDPVDMEGVCQSGQRVCQNNVVYACLADSWQQLMDCGLNGQQCVDGSCHSESDGDTETAPDGDVVSVCEENALQCNGNWVEICFMNAWVQQQNCEDTGKECMQGQCVEPGTCSDGQRKCIGNIVYTCASGQWQLSQECGADLTCSNGVCGCQSGETRCDDDRVMYCNGSSWVIQEDCADSGSECAEGMCRCYENEMRCSDTVIEECLDGNWSQWYDCATDDMACMGGQCQACVSGDVRCNGSVYEECFREAWEYMSDCAEYGQICTEEGCVDSPDGDVDDVDTDTVAGGCPGDSVCFDANAAGLMLCLNENYGVPPDAVMDCHNGAVCTANSDCYYLDSSYTTSACLFHCGECGAGTCTEGWPEDKPDYYMCLESNGGTPAGAAACSPGSSGECEDNTACFCADSSCTTGVCLEHCSP